MELEFINLELKFATKRLPSPSKPVLTTPAEYTNLIGIALFGIGIDKFDLELTKWN